jgi:hypothetical protein
VVAASWINVRLGAPSGLTSDTPGGPRSAKGAGEFLQRHGYKACIAADIPSDAGFVEYSGRVLSHATKRTTIAVLFAFPCAKLGADVSGKQYFGDGSESAMLVITKSVKHSAETFGPPHPRTKSPDVLKFA